MNNHPYGRATLVAAATFLAIVSASAAPQRERMAHGPTSDELFADVSYRNLGPFRAGAWVSDVAVPDSPVRAHQYTMYAATRSGGLFKTVNNGTTWDALFDDQEVLSIGDVALAPSNPEIVWAGTGGADNARSTYYGDGVYKSTDGGATWRNMGLADSHHIARIVIHPDNPDIVWVAAMGHLFTANPERGVFRTRDGGETWERVLFVDDNTGVIDLVINPDDADVLFAATYEKYRYAWHFESGGANSGIYKSTDGGGSWRRVEQGLPTGRIGRIGLDIYRRNPEVLYAVVENANLRPPTAEEIESDRSAGGESPERWVGGEAYRSDDGGETWRKMSDEHTDLSGKAGYSFNQIRIDPNDDQVLYVNSATLISSIDGGRTWRDQAWRDHELFPSFFGDVRAMWIDPLDSQRIILGTDGGVQISYDGGKTSDYFHNLPIGEFYAVGVDMDKPYNIYGGLQDHESWKGPINSWSGEVSLEDWVTVGSSDGMYNQVDPDDSRWLYNTWQHGGHRRVDQRHNRRDEIEPKRAAGLDPYRFTWNTPLVISPHDSAVLYTGGQMLLRSLDRGDSWQEISPDLTTDDRDKIAGQGNIQYCTITTISESPLTPGVIWVGTDDGRVWGSRDGGGAWTEFTAALSAIGGPADFWVSRVLASSHEPGTAYVTKSGYRLDDFRPQVFKTTDYGATWASIAANLPARPVNVILEDRHNADLLFVGNDKGVYVSIDAGARWTHMRGNMPRSLPVHDMVIHPRENDLVVGTYGRALWVTDVTAVQEMTEELLGEELHLFAGESKRLPRSQQWGNYTLYGDRYLTTPNERGLPIRYYLRDAVEDAVTITIEQLDGEFVRELEVEGSAGLREVVWDLRDAERRLVDSGRFQIYVRAGTAQARGRIRVRPAR